MATGEGKRIFLWTFWVANLLVDAVYVVMSWSTADNLSRASGNLHIENGWKQDVGQTARAFISNNIWRAPVAAAALGGLMVVLFNLLSCGVLLRRSMARGAAGFGYGFMLAWAFVLSFFTLLCGLVIEGFKDVVVKELEKTENWTTLATGAFHASYAFSYIVSALFMVFFLVLLLLQNQITKELGIYETMHQHKRAAEMGTIAGAGGATAPLPAGPI
ncbi:hypothetical protein Rsub_12626 [Raphidocelis subcapitata]|uniref:Transmembrane protein n=1 Tax=Raphidocelis subcapitata TaxID=307507 RepID=A0A2V0PP61_9CHLO|nr:hypothetical protein Rsub_12626 [Raphidocelis subcapitata]|eukprot:GBF99933.1 hypothetical protein Rsub_12626 [Raphidocelis subcapitata]